jgi:hypothetical protein
MGIEVALSDFTIGVSSETTFNGAFLQEKPRLAKAAQGTVIVKPL